MTVIEHDLPGAAAAYAVDGTPVDCVRFAALGLGGGGYDAIVSGANLGHNLGDDVTYSGTVAAALEGVLLGLPGIAAAGLLLFLAWHSLLLFGLRVMLLNINSNPPKPL